MGKTTCDRLTIGLRGGFHCFPMAGTKTHEIFFGFVEKRVISLIKLSLSPSFSLPKATARRY